MVVQLLFSYVMSMLGVQTCSRVGSTLRGDNAIHLVPAAL